MTWAHRLKRVFNIDIETCSACGGAMKVIACIEDSAGFKQFTNDPGFEQGASLNVGSQWLAVLDAKQPVCGDPLSAGAGGVHLAVKARKVAWGAVWEHSIGIFSSIIKDFLSMVFFMVLPHTPAIEPLILSRKNYSFTIKPE